MLHTLLQNGELSNTLTSSGVSRVYIWLILNLPFLWNHEEKISVSWVFKVSNLFTAMFFLIYVLYNLFSVFPWILDLCRSLSRLTEVSYRMNILVPSLLSFIVDTWFFSLSIVNPVYRAEKMKLSFIFMALWTLYSFMMHL